jgi:hypothetical protein
MKEFGQNIQKLSKRRHWESVSLLVKEVCNYHSGKSSKREL